MPEPMVEELDALHSVMVGLGSVEAAKKGAGRRWRSADRPVKVARFFLLGSCRGWGG